LGQKLTLNHPSLMNEGEEIRVSADDTFATTGSTAQEMGEGVTIVGFFLLMMKNTSSTTSVFAAVLMEKFDVSLKFLALTTNGIEALSCLHLLFVMTSLFLSILGLLMFWCNLPISWHFHLMPIFRFIFKLFVYDIYFL